MILEETKIKGMGVASNITRGEISNELKQY